MKKYLIILLAVTTVLTSCSKEEFNIVDAFGGKWTRIYVNRLSGFSDELPEILEKNGLSHPEFILLTTNKIWEYPTETQIRTRDLRNSIPFPTEKTLFQKIIPVSELDNYINNTDRSTINGYVYSAADIKNLYTMQDIYWGLRLDYEGSPFTESSVSYAVIRFFINREDLRYLTIPFCEELGGSHPHDWPHGGAGFISSTLGFGGYPEYYLSNSIYPASGAEIYEVNKDGYEIIRARYKQGQGWQNINTGYPPTTKAL